MTHSTTYNYNYVWSPAFTDLTADNGHLETLQWFCSH